MSQYFTILYEHSTRKAKVELDQFVIASRVKVIACTHYGCPKKCPQNRKVMSFSIEIFPVKNRFKAKACVHYSLFFQQIIAFKNYQKCSFSSQDI